MNRKRLRSCAAGFTSSGRSRSASFEASGKPWAFCRLDDGQRRRARAESLGQDLQTFVRQAALEKAERPTLTELLAPIHEDARRRGITTEQADEAIERAREAHSVCP